MNSNKEKILISYHANCLDGTSAAAVAKLKFKEAKFVPVSNKSDIKAKKEILNSASDCIYMLDNSFFLDEICKVFDKVVLIDHHEGPYEEIKSFAQTCKNLEYVYDNKKSGATLAWSYFFPDKKEPEFLWYIEDIDLWRWEGREKTEFVSDFASIHIKNLDKFVEFIQMDMNLIFERAKDVSAYKNMIVDYYINNAQNINIKVGEYTVKAYNVASIRPVVSKAGNILSERVGETVVLFKVFGDSVRLSFRSASEEFQPKAVELAKILGGNGHPLSAGAAMSLEEFVKSIVF